MGTALRWVLVPVASIGAWSMATFIGFIMLGVAESFCPADEWEWDMCTAPWFETAELCIYCSSTALSAIFVVAAAFFVAPAGKAVVAWLAFALGSVVALVFALGTWAWGMLASAVFAGLLTAVVLSTYHGRRAAKSKLVKGEIA